MVRPRAVPPLGGFELPSREERRKGGVGSWSCARDQNPFAAFLDGEEGKEGTRSTSRSMMLQKTDGPRADTYTLLPPSASIETSLKSPLAAIMSEQTGEIDLDSVIDRLLEGPSLSVLPLT